MKHVEIDTPKGCMRGMWHVGNGIQPVLMVHGYFGANRVGHARMYVKIANYLVQKYSFDVLRIDALGAGESDGDYADVSLKSFIDDFTLSVRWLTDKMGEKSCLPIVIGHSMGANVALLMHDIFSWKGCILIAPEVRINGIGVDKLFTDEQLRELKSLGKTTRKGITINSSFIDELRKISLRDLAKKIALPVSIIQGTEDELFDAASSECLSQLLSTSTFFRVKGANHNFLGPDNENNLFKTISQTIEWLEECR